MLPITLFSLPNHGIIASLHNSRRLLTPLFHVPQTTLAPSPNDQPILASASLSSHNCSTFDTNVVLVLSVLICAVICSLCINSVIKCVLRCSAMLSREPNYYLNMISNQKVSSGVDKRALKRFSVVKYSVEKNIQGLGSTDCVICLSEFKHGEKLRILPKCNHGFHVKCIDKWLSTHSSCPICRQSLVDTCQKIIGCDNQEVLQASLPVSSVGVTGEVIIVSIVPLQRENMVRGPAADDQC